MTHLVNKNMKKNFSLLILLLVCLVGQSQKTNGSVVDGYYPLLRNYFQEANAYKTVGFVEKYWRIAGNTGFNASIHYVENILQSSGFVQEVNG